MGVGPKDAERIRAFELFCTAGLEGKRRSLRSLALELGVQLSTIQYWAKHDDWEAKLRTKLTEASKTALHAHHAIQALLRKGVEDAVRSVKDLIADVNTKPAAKIMAMKAMADLAIKLQALTVGPMGDGGINEGFSDELDGDGEETPTEASTEPAVEPSDPPVASTDTGGDLPDDSGR